MLITTTFIEGWADIASVVSFMGTTDEAGYIKSILETAEIIDACLKKRAACAKALGQ